VQRMTEVAVRRKPLGGKIDVICNGLVLQLHKSKTTRKYRTFRQIRPPFSQFWRSPKCTGGLIR
jgi:hypothetical protein